MFIALGFEDAAGKSPDWEPEPEFESLQAAIASGEEWVTHHPRGRVDVVEVFAGVGTVVVVLTNAYAEVASGHRSVKRARIDASPLQLTGLVFLAVACLVMAFDDDAGPPVWATRLLGLSGVLLFGGSAAAIAVNHRRTRS